MNFLSEDLESYLSAHHDKESALLADLNRQTHLKILQPRMLSGALQGRYLSFLSKLLKPQHILEIGTYTGYSALCLAEGLAPSGRLDTIEINDELETFILSYFNRSAFADQLNLHLGDALEIIDQLVKPWDLVFIDADKPRYLDYYQKLIPHLKSGAVILADNVLWSGKVLKEPKPRDESTIALLKFNRVVQNDERVENMLLPFRDGLMCIRKK